MSNKAELGNIVKIVRDAQSYVDFGDEIDSRDIYAAELTVIRDTDDGGYLNWDDKTIEVFAVTQWGRDFELVRSANEDAFNKAIAALPKLQIPTQFIAEDGKFISNPDFHSLKLNTSELSGKVVLSGLGVGIGDATVTAGLGVYRPNLEDRKVGKVPMHMVVDGFPLALKAVGEIMGWARDVKGYKLHDWRNLPEADIAFPSAEYRHANENSIQKAQGLSALERVDHESGKLHVAHKVFNALAELELILSGKIQ